MHMEKERSTKEKVLSLLESRSMNFVSGQEIANTLFITRAGIWKAVKALREEGYNIEAVNNRGYRLVLDKDALIKTKIEELVSDKSVKVLVYDELESTNDTAREFALKGEDRLVVISDYQSKGKGRRGRSFLSPKGTGLYMSFLLRPNMDVSKATRITCMMAVAACKAIEKVTKKEPKIKWVNDLYMEEKKISGILTEGHLSMEDGSLSHVIVGIGINMYTPPEGFPDDLKDKAGVLFPEGQIDTNLRNEICAAVINEFMELYEQGESADFIEDYRKRSNLIGSFVKIIPSGLEPLKGYAKVCGIDDEFRLLVEHESGKREALSTGEVSVVKY